MAKAIRRTRARVRRAGARAAARLGAFREAIQRACADRWDRLKHWQKHWLWNIAIGLAIELALAAAHQSHFVVSAENWGMDATLQRANAVRQLRRLTSPDAAAAPPLVTLVDADEETWRSPEWGAGPYRAPRDRIAALTAAALASGSQYVVVDIVIEGPAQPDDAVLAARLESLQPGLKAQGKAVILARAVRDPLFAKDELAPVLPYSPLDRLTRLWPAQFINAAPYFVTDRDGVLRSWRLWRAVCTPDAAAALPAGLGTWKVLPSVQLAVRTLAVGAPSAPWTTAVPPGHCAASPQVLAYSPQMLAADGVISEAAVDEAVRRWLEGHQRVTGHRIEAKDAQDLSDDGERFDPRSRLYYDAAFPSHQGRIQVLSALRFLRPQPAGARPGKLGEITIIGQSSEAVGDMHATPLGAMPGAMVLANATVSMMERGIVQTLPEIWRLPITLLSIIAMGWLFARFDSLRGVLAIGVVFYGILVVGNYIIFRTDYWFDFAAPLIGLFADRLISAFEEHVKFRSMKARTEEHRHGTDMEDAR